MNSIHSWARTLSTINTILTIIVFCGCIGIIVAPLAPLFTTEIKKLTDETNGVIYETNITTELKIPEQKKQKLKPRPTSNWIVIPSAYVDGPIREGNNLSVADYAYWRRPQTTQPGEKGNTVIVGHRTFVPYTFFHLDQVKVGDFATIYWNGREYNYQAMEIREVLPSAVEVEAPREEEILTLYTCTPIYTAEKRLVVIFKPYVRQS